MRLSALFAAMLFATPALAADPGSPAKPATCGKSADECQKVVDDLTEKLAQMSDAYNGARQQRMTAEASKSDADLLTFMNQQAAARTAAKAASAKSADPPKK